MTAVEASGNDGRTPAVSPENEASKRAEPVAERGGTATGDPQNVEPMVTAARERFAAAVTSGVAELTGRYGYGRERAAALLLGEIRGGDSPPTDDEVFRAMEHCRMGMEEASKTVAVARALRRARSERGLSAVEAIDDLTSRLSIASLIRKVGSVAPFSGRDKIHSGGGEGSSSDAVAASERGPDDYSVSGSIPAAPKKDVVQRTPKCCRSNGAARNVSTTPAGRKRLLSACDNAVLHPHASGKSGKCPVGVDFCKKAKLAEDSGSASDTPIRSKSPAQPLPRTKRSPAHRGEDQQILAQQPAVKRARADGIL